MYDVRNLLRFEVARLISSLKHRDLVQVLCSTSFSELELGIVDVIDLLYEVEKKYAVHVPDKYLISSLEDIASLLYNSSSPVLLSYPGSVPAQSMCL